MSYILGLDTSYAQGSNIDFAAVQASGIYDFVIQRMSYSYPGQPSKYDTTASRNYYGFKGVGMIVGGYHKVGWTDPVAEADFFLQAMSPLSDGDLLAYDIEPPTDVAIPSNWSEWEQAFVQRIIDRTNAQPFKYKDISLTNELPSAGIVTQCAAWVAAPSYGWDATVPVNVPVIIQQGPTVHVPGITANVCDTDAFFGEGSVAELKAELLKYAYHPSQPAPKPNPTPTPAPAPTPEPPSPTPAPTPEPAPAPQPAPAPTPDPTPAPAPTPPVPTPKPQGFWQALIAFLKGLFHVGRSR